MDDLENKAAEYARERQSYGARVVIADFARLLLAEKEKELAAMTTELNRISVMMCGKPWASRNMDLPVYIQNQCDGREIAEKALDAAEQELHDIKEWWPIIMAEKCPKDEVHCTCVPALRIIAKNAEAQLAQLQADNAALREKVAGLEKHSTELKSELWRVLDERNVLTAKLGEAVKALDDLINKVDAFWTFDEAQKPTASWHDKNDCLDGVRTYISLARLTPAAPSKEAA